MKIREFVLVTLACLWSVNSNASEIKQSIMDHIQHKNLKQLKESIAMVDSLDWLVAGVTPLNEAVLAEDANMVEALVGSGASVNFPDSRGRTALMLAVQKGLLPIAKYLFSKGGDMHLEAQSGYAAFDFALESKHLPSMVWLLEKGIERAQGYKKNSAMLVKAILETQHVPDTALVKDSRNINTHNFTGYAALPMAVRLGKTQVVEALLKAGADVNIGNNGDDEAIPLNQAARAGDTEMAALLISHGAMVNKVNAKGLTPLMLAMGYGHMELANLLLKNGAEAFKLNDNNFQAVNYALQWRNAEAIIRLLNTDTSSDTLAMQQVINNDLKQLTIAFQNGIDVNQQSLIGMSMLSLAAAFGNESVAEYLLDQGADVHLRNVHGYRTTPLIDAARSGNLVIAKLLVEKGAKVKQGDGYGDPAINWATYYGHYDLVKYLLSQGADPMQQNRYGYTAVKTAQARGHSTISQLFEQHLSQTASIGSRQ